MRRGELAMIHAAQQGEISWRRFQCRGHRAGAPGIHAMTRRAIARVHLLAVSGVCSGDWDGDFAGGLIGITHGRHQSDSNYRDDWTFQHTFLGSGFPDLVHDRAPSNALWSLASGSPKAAPRLWFRTLRPVKQIRSEGDSTPCGGMTGCDRGHNAGIPGAPTYPEKNVYDLAA